MNSALRKPDVKPRPQTPWDLNREILASDLSHAASRLLLVIVDHAGHGRSSCTASTDTLAREARMTGRHVRNLLPGLEAAGWIQIERATGSRQSRHTIFLAPREGKTPFIKVHEVGNPGACSRKKPVHEVGNPFPTNVSRPAPENENSRGDVCFPQGEGKPQPSRPLRFPRPPWVTELERELASFGWTLEPDGRRTVRPGFSEGRELSPRIEAALDQYRARIAAGHQQRNGSIPSLPE